MRIGKTLSEQQGTEELCPFFRLSSLPTVLISNRRHSIIYWWISKSNSSKESCCEVEYEAYDKIHMWRISIVFFAYFDFVFYEPLKHDTYSPYISLIICIIFCYPLAIVWAITFENPSINEEMAAIWNFYVFHTGHKVCSCFYLSLYIPAMLINAISSFIQFNHMYHILLLETTYWKPLILLPNQSY